MMPISSKHTIAVILACLSSTLAFCQTDGLVLSSSAVSPGGTASLSLSLTSPAGSEPAGLQWTLVYFISLTLGCRDRNDLFERMMPISSKHTIAVILACLSSTLAFCQTDGLVLSSSAVSPGGTASLSLSLTSPAGSEPAGLQWTLVYSPTDIVALSALAGTSATAAGKSLSCAGSPGSYTCLFTGLNANIVQNGVVAVVTATISPSTTATYIGIANALGATQSASSEAITATGGTITTVVPLSLTSLSCN